MSPYTVIAVYVFPSSYAADHALSQLWRQLSGGFEKSCGEIWISHSCENIDLAGVICRALGGRIK